MMIKVRLLLFALLVSHLATAQTEEAGWVPGYVVTIKGDTLRGFVKRINNAPYQILDNIRYKESEEGKKKSFPPEQLKGFNADGKVFHPVKTPSRGSDNPGTLTFMELIIDGYVRMYRQYDAMIVSNGAGHTMSSGYAYYLLKRGERTLFDPDWGIFKNVISEYLSDNIELAGKIKTKEYKAHDLQEIIIEYNKSKH